MLLRLVVEAEIEIGRLGNVRMASGYYAYCGSALGGLEARIARHQRHEKKLHWHIDYFRQQADLMGVWLFPGERSMECTLASLLLTSGAASVPVLGFGSSDCHCPAHLLVLNSRCSAHPSIIPFETLVRAVDDIFRSAAQPFFFHRPDFRS